MGCTEGMPVAEEPLEPFQGELSAQQVKPQEKGCEEFPFRTAELS